MSSSLLPTESIFTRYFPFTAMHRVLGTCIAAICASAALILIPTANDLAVARNVAGFIPAMRASQRAASSSDGCGVLRRWVAGSLTASSPVFPNGIEHRLMRAIRNPPGSMRQSKRAERSARPRRGSRRPVQAQSVRSAADCVLTFPSQAGSRCRRCTRTKTLPSPQSSRPAR